MKEGFVVDYQTLIDQAKLLTDMELQAYLVSLSGPERNEFLNGQIANAVSATMTAKQQRYLDMSDKVVGSDNNITSASYYLARTGDLLNMVGDVDSVAAKQLSTLDINSNITRRQYEINEWANANKLDTLFFLQVLFISLTFISTMLFLRNLGYISHSVFLFFSYLAGIIAFVTLVRGARYTNVRRDSRYWHKARFGTTKNPFPTATTPSCPS